MTKSEIVAGLREMGLSTGDKVLLHSSLYSLGNVDGGADAVIDAFLEVLGSQGTLLVPVFGALGIITETLKKRPEAVISTAPVGTLAAIGADAETLCLDHWQAETAHGENTPFTRLAEMDGYVCLLGCDQDRNTSLHSVEALLRLPYMNTATTTFKTPDGNEITKDWPYYPGPHRDFIGLDHCFLESGAMKISRIGNAQVRLIKSQDLLDIGLAIGSEDPAFVLCDNPACADCVKQRAAIFADRISCESFKLTASAKLAGRYVPEMVEKLAETGIKLIELDYVQGKACAFMTADKLQRIAAELRENGIEISALSAEVVPDAPEKLTDLAKAAGIDRLILPAGAVAAAEYAVKNGLAVSFRNINHTALALASAVNEFKKENECSACFNPAAFVKAGEHPFLYSYRAGRFIKSIGQLDVVDALWDGSSTLLAYGNGEIKELISILRCHNYSGYLCLGGGTGYPGSLKEAADELIFLLDNM